MQEKDVRKNENLPLGRVVGAAIKIEKKSHCITKPISIVYIFRTP